MTVSNYLNAKRLAVLRTVGVNRIILVDLEVYSEDVHVVAYGSCTPPTFPPHTP
jgi:hypothetical protein